MMGRVLKRFFSRSRRSCRRRIWRAGYRQAGVPQVKRRGFWFRRDPSNTGGGVGSDNFRVKPGVWDAMIRQSAIH